MDGGPVQSRLWDGQDRSKTRQSRFGFEDNKCGNADCSLGTPTSSTFIRIPLPASWYYAIQGLPSNRNKTRLNWTNGLFFRFFFLFLFFSFLRVKRRFDFNETMRYGFSVDQIESMFERMLQSVIIIIFGKEEKKGKNNFRRFIIYYFHPVEKIHFLRRRCRREAINYLIYCRKKKKKKMAETKFYTIFFHQSKWKVYWYFDRVRGRPTNVAGDCRESIS